MSESTVEFRNTSYHINGREILSNLNLAVPRGETLVLLGRSGCGKTTALKLVNRLLEPTSGEVHVEGRPTTDWDAILLRRRIGYVIQEVGLFPHFTVGRNVALVPILEKWGEEKTQLRVRELLDLVGLEPDDFIHRYPSELSGGQRQRVGVARAVAADPPILLMDEPFGALDPLTRGEIQEEFRELQRQLEKTILFVTHDPREALVLGTQIAMMKAGRIAVCERPEGLLSSSDPEVVTFLKWFPTDVASDREPGT